jgi:hypothetical protein
LRFVNRFFEKTKIFVCGRFLGRIKDEGQRTRDREGTAALAGGAAVPWLRCTDFARTITLVLGGFRDPLGFLERSKGVLRRRIDGKEL